ncbi:glycosyltransferase family 4 protein [Glycocaulis profundi]|nr:glycosyltransferase family 4 protein [Glycocaulis profundi]
MNVLQVIPELDAGGAERTVIEIAEAVATSGGRALVASRGGRLEAELAAVGGELIRLDMKTKNPVKVWSNADRLAEIIAANGIDIVHARSRAPAWSALWAARRTETCVVTTYHGIYTAKSGLKRWYNSVMARGDAVIANSEYTAERVRTEHGDLLARRDPALSQLHVIPRGVDTIRFDPAAVSAERVAEAKAGWDVPEGAAVLLLPARLTRWKGQALAIEAVAKLNTERPIVLVCAGDPQGREAYARELRELAKAKGVALRLPGHAADMPAAFLAADAVLNPSLEPEAFGRTAAEAQAMGAPVVAADHGGAREAVAPGETGWLAAPGDADALAAALSEALSLDAEARAALAARARARIVARFSKTALQDATLRVYRELLQ